MDYEQMLQRALAQVPQREGSGERFELPKAFLEKAGRRTILVNLDEICQALRREQDHFIKFLLKELATKGEATGGRLFVLGVFSSEQINRKIELYVKTYVICPECGRPDTKLLREEKVYFLKCEACGARHPVV
ncbi:MAG: translation initiation factor IF-2 subunit beta [Candidatus Aenigmarchaeota archaeon]|nr:translation initiation factor IF-2 subunit beta [Candidatus Aenigmarchaeota archaeon]